MKDEEQRTVCDRTKKKKKAARKWKLVEINLTIVTILHQLFEWIDVAKYSQGFLDVYDNSQSQTVKNKQSERSEYTKIMAFSIKGQTWK